MVADLAIQQWGGWMHAKPAATWFGTLNPRFGHLNPWVGRINQLLEHMSPWLECLNQWFGRVKQWFGQGSDPKKLIFSEFVY